MDSRAASRADIDARLEKLATLLDRAIPLGKKFGIGLDSILGLVPGVGDLAGGVLSGYIMLLAYRAGVPKSTLLRMLANVGIDSALGSIPFVGDLFDIVFQSNVKNVELYRRSTRGEHRSSSDWLFLGGVLLALGILVAIPVLLLVWAVQAAF